MVKERFCVNASEDQCVIAVLRRCDMLAANNRHGSGKDCVNMEEYRL